MGFFETYVFHRIKLVFQPEYYLKELRSGRRVSQNGYSGSTQFLNRHFGVKKVRSRQLGRAVWDLTAAASMAELVRTARPGLYATDIKSAPNLA